MLLSIEHVFSDLSARHTHTLLFWHLNKKSAREPVNAATLCMPAKGGLRIYESADRKGNKGNALGTFAHFIFLIDLTEKDARTFAHVRYHRT